MVRETHTLRRSASASKPSSPFVLAPNDWILPPGFRVANLFFYARPAGVAAEEFMPVPRLVAAMQRVLDHYPILQAGFVRNDANGTIELDLDSDKAAVPFVSATAECTLDSLPLSQEAYTSTRVLPASLQLVHNFNYASPLTEPAWAIQHTRFACGGVCLGVHMHHIIGDASSFFQVMADWVRAYNDGEEWDVWIAANPPTIDRAMFRWSPEEVAEMLKGHEEDGYLVPSTPPAGWTPGPPNIARAFVFEADELRAMKAAATPSKEEAAKGKDAWVSTMEALSAHMIRCVYMARNPESAAAAAAAAATEADQALATLDQAFKPETLKFHLATNWRPRLVDPPAPPRYFGNGALYTPVLLPDPAALVRNNLVQNAALVHRAIARNDSKHLRGTMAWITSQPLRNKIVPNFKIGGPNDFAITAWHRFGAYGDAGSFGGVGPIRVCQPSFPGMDGIAILMPGPNAAVAAAAAAAGGAASSPASPSAVDGEAIEMILGLTEEAMSRLEANPEWRKFKPQAPAQ